MGRGGGGGAWGWTVSPCTIFSPLEQVNNIIHFWFLSASICHQKWCHPRHDLGRKGHWHYTSLAWVRKQVLVTPAQHLAAETQRCFPPPCLWADNHTIWSQEPDLCSFSHPQSQHESTWRTPLKAIQRIYMSLSFATGVLMFFLWASRMAYFHCASKIWKSTELVVRKHIQCPWSWKLDCSQCLYKPATQRHRVIWKEYPPKIKRKRSFGPKTDTLSIWSCPLDYLMLQLPCKIFNYVF